MKKALRTWCAGLLALCMAMVMLPMAASAYDPINTVSIGGIDAPYLGEAPVSNTDWLSVNAGRENVIFDGAVQSKGISWLEGGQPMGEGSFQPNTAYTLEIEITVSDGYTLAESSEWNLEGAKIGGVAPSLEILGQVITLTYQFPAIDPTAPFSLIWIT